MPLNPAKKRPLIRIGVLVVIAVLILHGLATWALLHLKMPHPDPLKPKLTAPIEIELITLPSSLVDSQDDARSKLGTTADSQAATSSSTSTANKVTQPKLQQQPSAQSATLASVTKPPSSRSQNEITTQANTNASSKAVANNINSNKSAANQVLSNKSTTTKPTSTTQRATTTTQSSTSSTTRSKPATSSQAASNASQSAIAATSQIETQTTIVAKPTTSTLATNSTVSNKSASSEAATAQSAVAQDAQGQRGGQRATSNAQTTGSSETNKGKGAGADSSNAKPEAAGVNAVVTGPFIFAESEAQWRKEPNLNSFKQNLFLEHDESTIRVRVSIEVNEKGRPTKVQVESGPLKARLANQLKRDLLSGEFVPFTRGGRAVAGTVKLPLRFVREG